MRALSLSFDGDGPRAKPGHALLAFGGAALALVIGAQAMIYQELERPELAAPAANTRRQASVLPPGVASEAEAMAGALTVVGHLAGPGDRLFVALESIEQPDVALLALSPDSRSRTLRIQAEGRGFEAMLAYLHLLEQSRSFTRVVLVDHEIQDSDPLRPLRFSLAASWGP